MGGIAKDLTGQRFAMLVVSEFAGAVVTTRSFRRWLCRCDCGSEVVVRAQSLLSGNTKSCGCQHAQGKVVHGHARAKHHEPEYAIWTAMKNRCGNPSDKAWKNYGGRGIRVCERWRNSYLAFISDVGRRPSPELSIDRINNDGNYEPGNVRWATREQQQANKRRAA